MRSKNISGFFFIIFWVFVLSKAYSIDEAPDFLRACHSQSANTLYWNNPEDVCGMFDMIVVYHRTSTDDPFEPIDTLYDTDLEMYEHGNGNQTSSEYYLEAFYDCAGTGSYVSDSLTVDSDPPAIVTLDSISYWDGSWVMGWSPTDDDIMGYIIYEVTDNANVIVDTNYGRNNTDWVVSQNDDIGNVEYRVAPFDSCRNLSPMSVPHVNSTTELRTDDCSGEVHLDWTGYQGWSAGVERYEVWMRGEGALLDYELIDSLQGDEHSITLSDLPADETLCFYVSAVMSSTERKTASTNRVCVDTEFISAPEDFYLQSVNYDNGNLDIQWEVSDDGDIDHFQVLRTRDTFLFEQIDVVSFETGTFQYRYLDTGVGPNDTTYYYKIRVVDECMEERNESNYGSNIVLSGEGYDSESDLFRVVYWSPYIRWDGGVDYYQVMHTSTYNDPNEWSEAGRITEEPYRFEDDSDFEEVGNAGICYQVTAREATMDPFGNFNTSRSNLHCFVEAPSVYIPNAFVPDGVNEVFNVEGQFIDYDRSSMKIFNRWGTMVYATDDIATGWNGLDDDKQVMDEGTYMYKIIIYGLDDDTYELHKGHVHLIR